MKYDLFLQVAKIRNRDDKNDFFFLRSRSELSNLIFQATCLSSLKKSKNQENIKYQSNTRIKIPMS